MTTEDRKKIYAALAAPFPEDAIQRTYANDHVVDGKTIKGTRKSYDTTGIAYQFVLNRLNEVLGVGGYRIERKYTVEKGSFSTGKDRFIVHCEVTMTLGEWVDGKWVPFAEAVGDGGHESVTLADAVKGAYTNGLKKTAAFFGVGRQAYEGTLDDDNVPAAHGDDKPKSGGRSSNPIGDAMRPSETEIAGLVKSVGAMLSSVDSVAGMDALHAEIQRQHKDVRDAIRKAHGEVWKERAHALNWAPDTTKSAAPQDDPVVKFSPKRWLDAGGADFKGKKASACDAAFLDAYAESMEYSANNPKPGKEQWADKDRAAAAIIREWAAFNRTRVAA